MKVIFNEPKEFIEELRKEKDRVHRRIVRVTIRLKKAETALGAAAFQIAVVATCRAGDELIVLEKPCGSCFILNDEVRKRANEVIEQLKKEIEEVGLEVRGGMYEP